MSEQHVTTERRKHVRTHVMTERRKHVRTAYYDSGESMLEQHVMTERRKHVRTACYDRAEKVEPDSIILMPAMVTLS